MKTILLVITFLAISSRVSSQFLGGGLQAAGAGIYGAAQEKGALEAAQAQQFGQAAKGALGAKVSGSEGAFMAGGGYAAGNEDYCEGYVCVEWLDDFGREYANLGLSQFNKQYANEFVDRNAYTKAALDNAAAAGAQERAGIAEGLQGAGYGYGGWDLGYGAGFGGNLAAQQAFQSGKAANAASGGAKGAAGATAALDGKNVQWADYNQNRYKNYGRKCRRYQCYTRAANANQYTIGPNYYGDVNNAYYNDNKVAASAAANARANQFAGAQAVNRGLDAGYGYGVGGGVGYW